MEKQPSNLKLSTKHGQDEATGLTAISALVVIRVVQVICFAIIALFAGLHVAQLFWW